MIWLIGSVVGTGTLISNIGKHLIISDQEYVLGDRYYEIESCKHNNYTTEKTTTCENEKKEMLIQSREVHFKENIINGTIRTIIFFLLLVTHYPRFGRCTKKD